MVKKILLAVLVLFMAMPAAGEYYQYKDAEGNLRFTDDLSNVPEDQQPKIKTFESAKEIAPRQSTTVEKSAPAADQRGSRGSATGDWEDKVTRSSEALDKLQAELQQTAQSLKQQQAALEAQEPGKDASDGEKTAYYQKVNALNARIEAYNKKHEQFNEKVKAFNKEIGRE